MSWDYADDFQRRGGTAPTPTPDGDEFAAFGDESPASNHRYRPHTRDTGNSDLANLNLTLKHAVRPAQTLARPKSFVRLASGCDAPSGGDSPGHVKVTRRATVGGAAPAIPARRQKSLASRGLDRHRGDGRRPARFDADEDFTTAGSPFELLEESRTPSPAFSDGDPAADADGWDGDRGAAPWANFRPVPRADRNTSPDGAAARNAARDAAPRAFREQRGFACESADSVPDDRADVGRGAARDEPAWRQAAPLFVDASPFGGARGRGASRVGGAPRAESAQRGARPAADASPRAALRRAPKSALRTGDARRASDVRPADARDAPRAGDGPRGAEAARPPPTAARARRSTNGFPAGPQPFPDAPFPGAPPPRAAFDEPHAATNGGGLGSFGAAYRAAGSGNAFGLQWQQPSPLALHRPPSRQKGAFPTHLMPDGPDEDHRPSPHGALGSPTSSTSSDDTPKPSDARGRQPGGDAGAPTKVGTSERRHSDSGSAGAAAAAAAAGRLPRQKVPMASLLLDQHASRLPAGPTSFSGSPFSGPFATASPRRASAATSSSSWAMRGSAGSPRGGTAAGSPRGGTAAGSPRGGQPADNPRSGARKGAPARLSLEDEPDSEDEAARAAAARAPPRGAGASGALRPSRTQSAHSSSGHSPTLGPASPPRADAGAVRQTIRRPPPGRASPVREWSASAAGPPAKAPKKGDNRDDRHHDPDKDGFQALDEPTPCPFKIHVSRHDGGKAMVLDDLGARSAHVGTRLGGRAPAQFGSGDDESADDDYGAPAQPEPRPSALGGAGRGSNSSMNSMDSSTPRRLAAAGNLDDDLSGSFDRRDSPSFEPNFERKPFAPGAAEAPKRAARTGRPASAAQQQRPVSASPSTYKASQAVSPRSSLLAAHEKSSLASLGQGPFAARIELGTPVARSTGLFKNAPAPFWKAPEALARPVLAPAAARHDAPLTHRDLRDAKSPAVSPRAADHWDRAVPVEAGDEDDDELLDVASSSDGGDGGDFADESVLDTNLGAEFLSLFAPIG
ncbi:hypothetical protein M885DRAFT_592474 [Pelagophyceae sp. CCMP2097]|nr:hypothetical protein M885DRAFT_592474 [Pelagophyceae sp. CCMP2097]